MTVNTVASLAELDALYVSPHTGGAAICPSAIGLCEQAYCHTPALMALAVGSLVSDRLGLDTNCHSQLCDHLAVYFLAIPTKIC